MAAKNVANDYDGRIRRAERLATLHPFTHEVLTFYKQVAQFQKSLYVRMLSGGKPRGADKNLPSLRQELQIEGLLPHFQEFLKLVAANAPVTLAESAHQLSAQPPQAWAGILQDYWATSGRDDRPNAAFDQFLPRAFLQPYAEHLAADRPMDEAAGFPSLCPSCGARPLIGVLRPEGDGGKRFLLCSFCLREWEFRRIYCATCAEETENKLPVYVAEQFPYIRVDACETCKFYLRTIDLTKDGNAVPLVDDLAAIPLSLWAEEHGYSRAQSNLLGT
ncbi:MAG TPA: formate dehydrogenase accessory protein FdhE [Methylomirabilota bacterium]|jgi:FdhE protein|nr:formate dehydrogenase accessory protein FdhE [Methylomirabilota bacterium]